MPQYNYETGQMEETDEERRAKEEAAKLAGTTVVGETKIKQYQDGSQTEVVTKEIPAPGFGDRLGTALGQAGTNFMNNIKNAPDNFMKNVQAAPDRFVQNVGNAFGGGNQGGSGAIHNYLKIPPPATPAPPAPAPVAPQGFQGQTDEMGGVDEAIARQAQMPAAPAQPAPPPMAQAQPAPVAPGENYNAQIARLESGANPNIGYHDRSKGTAFGTYGLTDAAYQDARRADPSLPADKTQATPAQQTAAMNAFTAGNTRQLQQFGIEPTPANLATAHLLGATGLKRFQESGYLSPQAIAANGGEEKLRQIIAQRQAGTGGPASGAVQTGATTPQPPAPPAPASPYSLATGQGNQGIRMPGAPPVPAPTDTTASAINRYQEIQNDPNELMKFAFSETAPDYLKQRAKDSLVEKYDQQKKEAQAQQAVTNATPKDIARAISNKKEGNSVGDWMQYLLLKHVGLTDLANQKGEQLGIGHKWSQSMITDDKGNDIGVEIQTTASGKVLSGNRLDGTALTAKELNTAGAAMGSKLNLVGGTFINDKTGEVGRVVSDEKTGKTYVQTDTGRKPMAGFRPQSSTGTAADQRAKLIQEMNIKLQGKAGEEAMAIQRDYNKLLVGQGLAPMQPGETPISAPQIAGAPAQVAGAPAAMPTPGAPAGAAPRPAAGAGAPTALPAAGAAAVPAAGPRPTASQIAATAEAQKQEAQEVGVDIGKIRTNFGKSKDAATRLINQAEELVTDKGFSVSVGASAQPFFQYIPGSDRATWAAKHEEVVGQTFLTAIENLKGMGALSDKEGSAATAAISRLKNTNQNEDSFKAAVKELQFIVKRGVDRNAEKLGKEKPFGTMEPEIGTAEMSPQSRAAAELEKRKKEKKP